MLKHKIHYLLALLVWILIGAGAPALVIFNYSATFNPMVLMGMQVPQEVIAGFAVVVLLVLMAMGTAKCSPMYVVLGVGCAALINFIGIPYTSEFTTFWWVVILLVTTLIGAGIGAIAFYNIVPEQLRLTKEEHNAKNPACKTCYAKSFCAWQPGAVFDQYKDKKIIPIASEKPAPPVAINYEYKLDAKAEKNLTYVLTNIKKGVPYRWNNRFLKDSSFVDASVLFEVKKDSSVELLNLLEQVKSELIKQGALKHGKLVHRQIYSAIYRALYGISYGDISFDLDIRFNAFYSYMLLAHIPLFFIALMLGVFFSNTYFLLALLIPFLFFFLILENGSKRSIYALSIGAYPLVFGGLITALA